MRVSPAIFAALQCLRIAVSAATTIGTLVGLVVAIRRLVGSESLMPAWMEALAWVVTVGGLPLMYLGLMISNLASGLMLIPKVAWSIDFEEETIVLRTPRLETRIPMADVSSFTHVWDDPWESLRGMEDSCLLIHLSRWRGRIVVPASSHGFGAAVTAISERRSIRSRDVS